MGIVAADTSVSLDEFITGPNAGVEHPLGQGGSVSTNGYTTSQAGASLTGWRAERPTGMPRSWTKHLDLQAQL